MPDRVQKVSFVRKNNGKILVTYKVVDGANGYEIIGEDYKKDRFPDMEPCSAKTLLNKKSFYIGKAIGVNEAIYTKELSDEIAECFRLMSDIFRLLADEQ